MIPSFGYHDGLLHFGEFPLRLEDEMETPCYLYHLERVLENYQRVQDAFPEVDIHYSLKANANLSLIKALYQAGAGMDAVSGGEIYRALQVNLASERIVFAGVGKTRKEIAYALAQRVGWINVESVGELARIKQIASDLNLSPRVALRINPDVHADTHTYMATGHAAAKFGISLEEARQILQSYAPQADRYRIEGIHIHIGSQLQTVERTREAIRSVRGLFEQYTYLETLNLGGGLPVSYNDEPVPTIEDFAAAIHGALAEFPRPIKLILEPGRSIVADAGILLVEVQYVKHTPQGVMYICDGGMTELIRPALYGAQHAVWPVRQSDEAPVLSHVVGPVCESADVLRANIMLPPQHEGDLLAISHVGAYGAVMGSNYNARPRPAEWIIRQGRAARARRAETWDNLAHLETWVL